MSIIFDNNGIVFGSTDPLVLDLLYLIIALLAVVIVLLILVLLRLREPKPRAEKIPREKKDWKRLLDREL